MLTPHGNVIEVIVRVVDQATAGLRGISNSLTRFGSTLQNVKNLFLVAIGGWSLNKIFQQVMEADKVNRKLEQTYRNLGASVGVTKERMVELANEMRRTTMFDDESIKAGEAALMSFNRVRGAVFERAVKSAADLAAATGSDVTGAMQRLGRALQDPARGLYLLTRSGITLTAQQREMIKEMMNVGNVVGAQNAILDALDKKYKGFAADSIKSLSGAFSALQNQIAELVEGEEGSFDSAVAGVNELTKTLDSPGFKAAANGVVTALAFMIEKLGIFVGLVAQAAQGFGEFVGKTVQGPDTPWGKLTEQIEANAKAQLAVRQHIAGLQKIQNEKLPGYDLAPAKLDEAQKQLASLRAEYEKLNAQRAEWYREISRQVVPGATAGSKPQPSADLTQQMAGAVKNALAAAAPPPLRLGIELDATEVEGLTDSVRALYDDLRSETAKAADDINSRVRQIAQTMMLTDEQLAAAGLTRGMLDEMMVGVGKTMDAAIAKGKAGTRDAAQQLEALAEAGLLGAQQTARGWQKTAEKIDEALRKGAITAEQAALSRVALRESIREQVLPMQRAEALPGVESILPQVELIRAALEMNDPKVSAEEAAREIQLLVRSLEDAKRTGFAAEVESWVRALEKIDQLELDPQGLAEAERAARDALPPIQALNEALKLGSDEFEQMAEAGVAPLREMAAQIARLYPLLDTLTEEQLIRIGVDKAMLDEAIADINAAVGRVTKQVNEARYEPNQFAIQAARTIQSTFADAFMAIGEGWQGVVTGFINGFKRIIAEAAAMQLAKVLGLTEILEGKAPTTKLGGFIGTWFPGTVKPSTAGQPAAAAPLKVEVPPPLKVEVPPPLKVEPVPPIQMEVPALPEMEAIITASRVEAKPGVDSRGQPTERSFPLDRQGFPIDTTRPAIINEDASFSTEETITEWVDGLWRNIPTIVNGVRVTAEEAVAAATDAIAKGWKYPSFETREEAELAAKDRSRVIATVRPEGVTPRVDVASTMAGCCAEMGDSLARVDESVAEAAQATQAVATAVTEAAPAAATQAGESAASKETSIVPALREVGRGIEGMLDRFTGGLYSLLKPIVTSVLKLASGFLQQIWSFVKAAIAALKSVTAASAASSAASSSGGWLSALMSLFAAAGTAALPAHAAAVVGEESPEIVSYRAAGGLLPQVVGKQGPEAIAVSKPAQVHNVRQLEFAGLMSRAGTDHREQIAAKMQQVATVAGLAGGGVLTALSSARQVGEETPELLAGKLLPGTGAHTTARGSDSAGEPVRLDFRPQYNITISGARDDKAMMVQIAGFIESQDQRNKAEIMEMLRRNGFGRMRR